MTLMSNNFAPLLNGAVFYYSCSQAVASNFSFFLQRSHFVMEWLRSCCTTLASSRALCFSTFLPMPVGIFSPTLSNRLMVTAYSNVTK